MVQLSDDLVTSLDQAAQRRGASRSALIRELLWEGLAQERHALIGERIADGYRRLPPGEPEEWGEMATGGDVSTEELLLRLDAEERQAGHEPW